MVKLPLTKLTKEQGLTSSSNAPLYILNKNYRRYAKGRGKVKKKNSQGHQEVQSVYAFSSSIKTDGGGETPSRDLALGGGRLRGKKSSCWGGPWEECIP